MVVPAPPLTHYWHNGTWPLRHPRLPLHTPSGVVVPGSSPFRLFPCSPSQSSLWVWSLKPKLPYPALACTGRQVSQARKCRAVVLTVYACLSLFWLLQTGCCVLLWGSEAPPLSWLISPAVTGLARVQEPFLFYSSIPGMQVLSRFLSHFLIYLFVCLFIYCPTWLRGDFLALSEVWGLLPVFSRYSVRIVHM